MSRYTFRDTDPAEVRLALLAKVFEPEMRVLLARLRERPVRFALDLGVCAVGMIVARKWGIEARFSRFGGA